MPFSESIKRKVKERAHYKCCLCRKHWVADVHHIEPESEDGPNTEENAAPLCANCHDLLGGNPDKRKFIKQNRDFWYDFCEKSSPADAEQIKEMFDKFGFNNYVTIVGKRLQNARVSERISTIPLAGLGRVPDSVRVFSPTL